MAYGVSNGHVIDDVAWPSKVMWGSAVGYPSDSVASCFVVVVWDWTVLWLLYQRTGFRTNCKTARTAKIFTAKFTNRL